MKKYLIIAALVLGVGQLFGQHVATLTGKSNFKTTPSGLVRLEFTLDKALSEKETTDIVGWVEDNFGIAVIEIDGVNVAIGIVAEAADRNAFDKAFHMMNIDEFMVPVGNEKKKMVVDQFFAHFNM